VKVFDTKLKLLYHYVYTKGNIMIVAIRKWGNSLALRIPKDIAQTLHIENNSMLELNIKDGALIIKPQNET